MLTIEALKNLYVKMGGSLSDTYPFASGTVGEYTYIPYLIEACSQKYSAGGGAEKFVVTLTQENDTWTADKTVAEIVAADEADQVVVCKVAYEDDGIPPLEIPLSAATDNIVLFGGVIMHRNITAIVSYGVLDGDVTEWIVESVELGSTNASLIVTLTAGATEGQFIGNKTYSEAYDAFIAGRNVVFYAPDVNGVAETVMIAENNTNAANPYALSTKSFASSGTANDYITITGGG